MYAERVICTILEREKVVKQKSQQMMSPIRSAIGYLSIWDFYFLKKIIFKLFFFLKPAKF